MVFTFPREAVSAVHIARMGDMKTHRLQHRLLFLKVVCHRAEYVRAEELSVFLQFLYIAEDIVKPVDAVKTVLLRSPFHLAGLGLKTREHTRRVLVEHMDSSAVLVYRYIISV